MDIFRLPDARAYRLLCADLTKESRLALQGDAQIAIKNHYLERSFFVLWRAYAHSLNMGPTIATRLNV